MTDVDSKPSTINLKFPAFDWDKAHESYNIEHYNNMDDLYEDGAKWQHSIDAQHFEAVVTELMEIVEMQRKAIIKIDAMLAVQESRLQQAAGDVTDYVDETLAAVDERLAKLKKET